MGLKRILLLVASVVVLTATSFAQNLPAGVQKVTSIEGVTEYAFPNGLHVLLFPDNSKPKVTVNIVYLVGSRNEGYGETGMAHLLEHMVFKTTKSGRELFKELTDRAGGNFNGTTDYDQTKYFETFNASDENLRWALGLEADRMVNMTMLKKDLDTRNDGGPQRNGSRREQPDSTFSKSASWPPLTTSTTTARPSSATRTDVERVPIDNLAVFYRKYYQPDNAVLIIAGQFDESKALASLRKPSEHSQAQRTITQPYTWNPPRKASAP